MVSAMNGTGNFTAGFFTVHDFNVVCLYCSGFLLVVMIYRIHLSRKLNKPITRLFTENYYIEGTSKINVVYTA